MSAMGIKKYSQGNLTHELRKGDLLRLEKIKFSSDKHPTEIVSGCETLELVSSNHHTQMKNESMLLISVGYRNKMMKKI